MIHVNVLQCLVCESCHYAAVLCVSNVIVLHVMQVVLQEQQSSGDGEGAALALLPSQ